jgi:hypothetical protein
MCFKVFKWELMTKRVAYRNNLQQNGHATVKKSNAMGCQATRSITHITSKLKTRQ